ncbi:MAG: sodium:solute symporter family transporter, partial [Lentisphaeria bacterium]
MKLKTLFAVFITLITIASAEKRYNAIEWNAKSGLPLNSGYEKQVGLAGSFSGVIGKDKVVFAGGSNFVAKPLLDGGAKIYHDDIFVSIDKGQTWSVAPFKLPSKMAHGASVASGDVMYIIGGEEQDVAGKVKAVNTVRTISSVNGNLVLNDKTVPALPFTFSYGSALILQNKIHVIGGYHNGMPSSAVYTYDLLNSDAKWEHLTNFPGEGRVQIVAVAQNLGSKGMASFYVFGGYNDKLEKPVIFTDGFSYLPERAATKVRPATAASWVNTAAIKPHGQDEEISVLGASGVPIGMSSIMVLGGYNKDIFANWLNTVSSLKDKPEEFKQVKDKFFAQAPEDFKWNRQVLIYNTITDVWTSLGDTSFLPNCGAALQLVGKNEFLLMNGEIMPGVRTNQVMQGKFINNPSFGMINWVVLIFYFIGMLLLGFYFMRREGGAEDFMTGGGRIPWWAAGVSIFATMLSSLSFMSIPAMTYMRDWRVFPAAIAIFICVPVITCIYLPFFRRLNLTSAYEYLEARFNVAVRSIASLAFIVFMVVRIGIVLYLPAVALSAVTGISVLTCILVIGFITIAYCALGGIEAVVWGDFVQGLVLIGGALVALCYLIFGTEGGFGGFVSLGEVSSKFRLLDFAFDFSQPTFWVIALGGFSNNLISYTSDQSVVQRYLTTKDEAGARKSLWLNGILSVPVSVVFYAIGTALYTFYKSNPMDINVAMENSNQVFPHFMMSKLPVGLAGILIAAVFSATMSTLSSNINSAATAYTTDFYQRFFNRNATDKQSLSIVRNVTILVGVLGIFVAFAVYKSGDQNIFDSFNSIIGLLVSGLGGLFAIGIFTKRVSGTSALLGYFTAAIVLYMVQQFKLFDGWFYGFIGLVVCFIASVLYSIIFPNK